MCSVEISSFLTHLDKNILGPRNYIFQKYEKCKFFFLWTETNSDCYTNGVYRSKYLFTNRQSSL